MRIENIVFSIRSGDRVCRKFWKNHHQTEHQYLQLIDDHMYLLDDADPDERILYKLDGEDIKAVDWAVIDED